MRRLRKQTKTDILKTKNAWRNEKSRILQRFSNTVTNVRISSASENRRIPSTPLAQAMQKQQLFREIQGVSKINEINNIANRYVDFNPFAFTFQI